MKSRYIFDEDYTLLTPDWSTTDQYFIDKFGDEAKPFLDNMSSILKVYERTFRRYDYEDLSRFLTHKTNLPITKKDVKNWDELVRFIKDTEETYARDLLEYLKLNGVSLAVCTNWFADSQRERLRRADLLKYFDSVFAGDIVTKPHKAAYLISAAQYDPNECTFVGDNVDFDYIGPKAVGMNAILYDKRDKHHKTLIKVRSLKEIKDYWR